MSDTLGSLVDKLSITNIKLWHVQDEVNLAAEMEEGVGAGLIQKLVTLNRQRTKLMNEIDKAGGGEVEERIKL
jgi:hypothetical protein